MSTVDPAFHIYVDRLRGGKVESLDAELDASFLEVSEEELQFLESVTMKGEAYLAGEDLIVKVSLATNAQMPCKVCNQLCLVPLEIRDFLQVFDTDNLKRGYVDLRESLREALLLELPLTAECFGECKEREALEHFMHDEDAKSDQEEGYHPFADLTLDDEESLF